MAVFNLYSEYYNLLYADKDYLAEAGYITDKIRIFNPEALNILNLGCGTGKHDFILSENGFNVVGLDLSEQMLQKAEEERRRLEIKNVQFYRADIREFELNRKFDVVISLFHVMSYQNSNSDVNKVMQAAASHLNEGGLFIFDFWYGPAVLTQKPEVKIKRMENDLFSVTRISEPESQMTENLVKVNFDLFITDKKCRVTEEIRETHSMRYFFEPELDLFLANNDLEKLQSGEWMTGKKLGADIWNALYICRKTGKGGC